MSALQRRGRLTRLQYILPIQIPPSARRAISELIRSLPPNTLAVALISSLLTLLTYGSVTVAIRLLSSPFIQPSILARKLLDEAKRKLDSAVEEWRYIMEEAKSVSADVDDLALGLGLQSQAKVDYELSSLTVMRKRHDKKYADHMTVKKYWERRQKFREFIGVLRDFVDSCSKVLDDVRISSSSLGPVFVQYRARELERQGELVEPQPVQVVPLLDLDDLEHMKPGQKFDLDFSSLPLYWLLKPLIGLPKRRWR